MKSFFIDTNYFIRLLLKDNKNQFKEVYYLFQKAIKREIKILTSTIVFFEIYWVLSSFYKKNKKKIIFFLKKILQMDFLEIENRELLQQSLILFEKTSFDLEDCFNIAFFKEKEIDGFLTFDKKINSFLNKKNPNI